MRNQFIVRVTVTAPFEGESARALPDPTSTREYRFSKLPISIGRAQDNDLEIASQFVSGRHARIEEVAGSVCVRDLGSRNGVHVLDGVESVRIPPQTAYPVPAGRFELQLGSETWVQVEHGSGAPLDHAREHSGHANRGAPPLGPSGLSEGLPYLPGREFPPPELPPLHPSSRAGDWPSGALSLPLLPQREPDGQRAAASPASFRAPAAGGFEPVQPRPGARTADRGGQAPELKTGSFDLGPEALALQGLRELVASLCPGQKLETQGDVARLITRLHSLIEITCRSYLALRAGHAQFVSSLQLQQSGHHDPARLALDGARDAGAVAGVLLDFREHAAQPGPALETALNELSVHQVALLDGMMQGVRALLEELAPEGIQLEVEQRRGVPRLGRADRALWDEYCERYARLAQEGEAFARVFGEEFAVAYSSYQRSRRLR